MTTPEKARTVRGWLLDEREAYGDRPIQVYIEAGEGSRNVTIDGELAGCVMLGAKGGWFFVPVGDMSHADPLDGLDAVEGYGHRSPTHAVVKHFGISNYQVY